MVKEKKILTEILPKSAPVSQELVDKLKRQQMDGKVIYEEYTNHGKLFCLNCEHSFSVNETGDTRCPFCGNSELRKAKRYPNDATKIRTLEKIDGFLVIKDTVVEYRESVTDGAQMNRIETEAIVVQGSDVAFFERLDDNQNNDTSHWVRNRNVRVKHYYSFRKIKCREYDASILEGTPFADVQNSVQSMEITSLFNSVKKKTQQEHTAVAECPEFDEGLINYPKELSTVYYEIRQREESLDSNGVFRRYHFWCTHCGKYSTEVSVSRAYVDKHCMHCDNRDYAHITLPGLNYLITSQEFADGTLLLRVDEAYCRAYAKEPLLIGKACEVYRETTIDKTAYLYITLDGQAYWYNNDRKPIDRFGILLHRLKKEKNIIVCSDDQKAVILQNKAMRRTGFVEYVQRNNILNLDYFNAMQKTPYLEIFSKMGFDSLIEDIIYTSTEEIPAFLRKKSSSSLFKKLGKLQVQKLLECGCSLKQFENYMQIVKLDSNAMFRDVEWISSRLHIRHISRILRLGIPNMTVKKIREYLEQVDDAQCCPPYESAQLWADYLQMLKILECDLSDRTVIYPNSLKREHDKASRKASQVQDEWMAKKFRERAEDNEWCIWENDIFKVVIPHEVTELYEEGRKLHHCVGSYGRMVSDGKCVVAFIRRKGEEDIPLCTVEICKKEIVQARGMCNKSADQMPKVRSFIKQWAKEKGLTYEAA